MATRKKRRHPRTRAEGLRVLLPQAGGVTPCSVEDISLGGVFIKTNEQFLPGTQLAITLVRPGMSRGLKVLSTVAQLRTPAAGKPAGVGVRFDVITDDTRTRLASLLTEFGVQNPEAEEEDVKYEALEPDAIALDVPVGEDPELALGRPFLSAGNPQDSDPDADSLSDVSLSMEADAAIPKVPPASLRGPHRGAPDLAPDLMDRLQRQIRGLILQLGALEQRLTTKDSELTALRRRVAELESLLGKRDLEIARLKAEARR